MPGYSILLIDNGEASHEPLKRFFEERGHRLICSSHKDNILKIIRNQPIDLIVLDESFAALHELQPEELKRQDGADLPIVLISNREPDEKGSNAVSAFKVIGRISKPLSGENLLQIIEGLERENLDSKKGQKSRVPLEFEILDSLDVAIFLVQDLKIVYCNEMTCRLTGYEKNELLGREVEPLFLDTIECKISDLFERCMKEGESLSTKARIRHKSGGVFLADICVVRTLWHNTPAIFVMAKQTKEPSIDDQIISRIIEFAPFGVYVLKKNRFVYVNKSFLKLVGYTWEELSNMHSQTLIYPDDREKVRHRTIKMLKQELDEPYRYRYVRKDGSVRWVLEKVVSLKNVGREKILAGFFLDITNFKEAEEELARRNKEFEDTINSITSLFILVDENGIIKKINRSAQNVFNIQFENTYSYHIGDLFKGDAKTKVLNALKKCREAREKVWLDDLKFKYIDGKVGYLGLTFTPIEQNDSEMPGVIVLGADITEEKNLMSQVLQSQKLEAIGQLAAGIAHEINTPIQYIGDNLRFISSGILNLNEMFSYYEGILKNALKDQNLLNEISKKLTDLDVRFYLEELPKAVEQSLEGVDRITKIVISMKNFAHAGGLDKVQFDVNKAIESTVTVSKNAWKYVADLELKLDQDLPPIMGYPGEFNQVILNLIVNAVHAIEDVKKVTGQKGKIVITTQRQGDFVLVSVSDTGTGIPKEIQNRIFDPFFTTKDPGKGTGQGLAISHRYITEMHKGQLYFESEVGKGTTFYIKLPIT